MNKTDKIPALREVAFQQENLLGGDNIQAGPG